MYDLKFNFDFLNFSFKTFQTGFSPRFVIETNFSAVETSNNYARDAAQVHFSYCRILARSVNTTYARLAYIPEKEYTKPLSDCDEIKITIWIRFPFSRFFLVLPSSVRWKFSIWFFRRFLARADKTNTPAGHRAVSISSDRICWYFLLLFQ